MVWRLPITITIRIEIMSVTKADDYFEFVVKLAAGFYLGWIIFLGNDALVEFWCGFLDALI